MHTPSPGMRPAPTHSLLSPLIDAVGLERRFGPTVAVADVSLQVARGEVVALLGPNGAGKTTTMQMLAGLLPPTAGHAMVAGHDVVRASARVRAHVGLMVDEPGFYPEMSVEEYLLFVAQLYRIRTRDARVRLSDLLERFGLTTQRRMRLSSLSKGMRQKVALLRAIIHTPPVLLLDEPTSALDPLSAQAVHRYIVERRGAGDAIVISTHNLPEAEALADRVAIIAAGRLRRLGTPADLCRAPDGRETFILAVAGGCADTVSTLLRDAPDLYDVTLASKSGRHRVTYRTGTPDRSNAALTSALAARGIAVLTLAHQPRPLQAVYLQVIEEATCPPPA
jgi:ABC-2 type transport system ATP-binding protein